MPIVRLSPQYVSIILLCTWSIQNLNIPASRPHTRSSFKKIWWAILDSRKKIKWMVLTVLVPEYLMGKAFSDWSVSKDTCNQLKSAYGDEDGVEWEMIHTHFANMGGFALDFSEVLRDKQVPSPPVQLTPVRGAEITAARMEHRLWALNAQQLYNARSYRLIQTLPRVTVRELERLRKGNPLTKFLAILQVTWLITQLIARGVQHLPSSQLEIGALAFSAASLFTYLLLWDRPQGVQSVHVMKATRFPTQDEMLHLLYFGPRYPFTGRRTRNTKHSDLDLVAVPYDAISFDRRWSPFTRILDNKDDLFLLNLSAIPGGLLFGGLHFLAWNFHFPTPSESLLWRICSVAMTALPIASIPFHIFWSWSIESSKLRRHLATLYLVGVIVIPYALARLFVMVELFRTLLFLPPEAFIETWSVAFPHWG